VRYRAGIFGGGFAVEEPSGWEASETHLRGAQVLAEMRGSDRPSRISPDSAAIETITLL